MKVARAKENDDKKNEADGEVDGSSADHDSRKPFARVLQLFSQMANAICAR